MVSRRFMVIGAALAALLIAGGANAQPQNPKAAGKSAPAAKWVQPRTPDGQPDMGGVWTNATLTPFERPASLGSKQFFTEEEAAVEGAVPSG